MKSRKRPPNGTTVLKLFRDDYNRARVDYLALANELKEMKEQHVGFLAGIKKLTRQIREFRSRIANVYRSHIWFYNFIPDGLVEWQEANLNDQQRAYLTEYNKILKGFVDSRNKLREKLAEIKLQIEAKESDIKIQESHIMLLYSQFKPIKSTTINDNGEQCSEFNLFPEESEMSESASPKPGM